MKKTELMAQIDALNAEHKAKINELKEQIEEQSMKACHDGYAKQLKSMYDSYVEAGFTEAQAWEIVTILLKK